MKEDLMEATSDLAFFLLFLKAEQPNAMWGGIRVQEAWEGFCRIVRPGDDPDLIESFLMKGLRVAREE